MSEDFLGDRGRALEGAFFAKENEKAVKRIREAQEKAVTRESLSEASGIRDEAVLDQLIEAGVRAETLAVLSLYPLVAVAWADRFVAGTERRAIRDAALESGIEKGDPAHDLLENWLEHRPGDDAAEAWATLIGALKSSISSGAFLSLKEEVLGRATAVAKAAGGILGLGLTISKDEQRVIAELAAAFE